MEKIADRVHKLYVNLQYIRKDPKPQELQIFVESLLSEESLFLKVLSIIKHCSRILSKFPAELHHNYFYSFLGIVHAIRVIRWNKKCNSIHDTVLHDT